MINLKPLTKHVFLSDHTSSMYMPDVQYSTFDEFPRYCLQFGHAHLSYFTKRFGKTFSNNSHLEKVLLIGNLITDLETLMPKKHQSKSMIKN